MKDVHEVLVPSMGLLLVLSIWIAAPNTVLARNISFQLSDGDKVSCIPIEQQLSLKDGRKFYLQPNTSITPGGNSDALGTKLSQQTIAWEKRVCPNGTIPVRESPWLLGSVASVGKAEGRFSQIPAAGSSPPHEYVVATINPSKTPSANFTGSEVFLNIWKPYVEGGEFSLAQLWMYNDYGPLNTIEAGYQVYNGYYGDGLPRLFVYWTADGYNQTGCYDLTCSGFVQTSNKVLLGGSFKTISRHSGQQYEIKLRVFKDVDGAGDWWLQLNDGIVGYWPKNLYKNLQESASTLQWGGEIVDDYPNDGGNHTRTQMGGGQFASKGYRKAAFQRNLQYIQNKTLFDAPLVDPIITDANCYSYATKKQFKDWRTHFFYGGKGYNVNCASPPNKVAKHI